MSSRSISASMSGMGKGESAGGRRNAGGGGCSSEPPACGGVSHCSHPLLLGLELLTLLKLSAGGSLADARGCRGRSNKAAMGSVSSSAVCSCLATRKGDSNGVCGDSSGETPAAPCRSCLAARKGDCQHTSAYDTNQRQYLYFCTSNSSKTEYLASLHTRSLRPQGESLRLWCLLSLLHTLLHLSLSRLTRHRRLSPRWQSHEL
jgi:hypothetical protein